MIGIDNATYFGAVSAILGGGEQFHRFTRIIITYSKIYKHEHHCTSSLLSAIRYLSAVVDHAPSRHRMFAMFTTDHKDTGCALCTSGNRVALAIGIEAMESEWFRDAMRLSLKASLSTNSTQPGPPRRNPQLRKIVEGILYSRKFILTYHLVILGVLLLLTAVHWTDKFNRWRKRRATKLRLLGGKDVSDEDTGPLEPFSCSGTNDNREPKGVYSSGSSTVEGSASPPPKDIDQDEDTPLLQRVASTRPTFISSVRSNIKAFLMYQPRPIPIINKLLPPNGTSIVVLAFLALNLFYMFFHINFNVSESFVLADRIGLVFVANLPLLYLLAAKTQPLKLLTGRSYESLNIFHRRLGELLCLAAFLHGAGMVFTWYIMIRPNGLGFVRFLLLPVILLGFGAFISYELLYFTSLGSFRQRWYELFLGSHVALQVAALVFLFFHHVAAKPYVAISMGIFLVDRLVYRLAVKSITVDAQTKILEDEETVRLSSTIIRRPKSYFFGLLGKSIASGWQATDHVFVTVPSISWKHITQAHPFTIASAAPTPEDEVVHMDLLVRAQDGFSRDLLNAARLHKNLTLRLDGPYGSSHARNMLEDSDLALLIAGGSGIAVCWPLVQHLLDTTRSSDTEIASTFSLRRQKIVLIWVIHEGAHLSWLGRHALAAADNRGAEILVPRATEEIGRPNLKEMMKEIIELHAGSRGKRIRVVASGPDGMGRMVRNTCAALVRDKKDVDVTIEKFGW
jgi:NAD(P)H-flavin reductase